MGELYDLCQRVDGLIAETGRDVFQVRGALAIKAGFMLSLVTPDDEDDPKKIEALKAAASDLFGSPVL